MARGAFACLVAAATGLLAACGPTVPTPGPPPTAPAAPPAHLALEAAEPGAAAYNAPTAPPRPGEPADRLTRVVQEVAAALGRELPRRDARLDAACRLLARTLPDQGVTPFDLVEFAVQHAGILEPPPHLLIATVPDEALPAFEADLRIRVPGVLRAGRYRRLGVGSAPGDAGRRIVIAFQESFVETDPIPRALPPGGATPLRGRVLPPFTGPHLLVTRPDGSVARLPGVGDATAFSARFTCGANGRYQVEVTADDAHGATVLANFPIFCGVPVPTRTVVASGEDNGVVDAVAAEGRLLELLNADRRRAGLPPLRWDGRLARVARSHSRDMMDGGFVGHVSARTGDPATRVARAGLRFDLVLENVARAYSLGEAQRGLMQSPGHRRNCLSPEVTHVGIGVVLGREVGGRREVYVTQLFAAEPAGAARP
jgi:uncharacterized protein YkwD